MYLHIIHIYIFFNITVVEGKKKPDTDLLSAFNCPNSIFFLLKKFTSPLRVLWKLGTVHVPQGTIPSQSTKSKPKKQYIFRRLTSLWNQSLIYLWGFPFPCHMPTEVSVPNFCICKEDGREEAVLQVWDWEWGTKQN